MQARTRAMHAHARGEFLSAMDNDYRQAGAE